MTNQTSQANANIQANKIQEDFVPRSERNVDVSVAAICGAFLGAGAVALTWLNVATYSKNPDIGVHFSYKDFDDLVPIGRKAAVAAARDLGAIPEKQIEEALRSAVDDWYKGGTGNVIIHVPASPELRNRVIPPALKIDSLWVPKSAAA